jgi:isoleucyl-tRNA synthetase
VKDRLYTFAPKSAARRSAQTAMWRIAEALTRLIAPILSFTADEVWQYLPKLAGREASVHLALFPEVQEIVPGAVAGIEEEWAVLLRLRSQVLTQLETLRVNKAIGKSLDASVKLMAAEGSQEAMLLSRYEASLPEFLNVSQVMLQFVGETKEEEFLLSEVGVAEGAKCERCWRVVPDVGADDRWPEVCCRCAEALEAIGFEAVAS